MNSISKGRLAEASVVAALVGEGFEVYMPTFGNGICDLIAMDATGATFRVEVKYTQRRRTNGWEVNLRQVRPNGAQMTVKKFNAEFSDVLGVYVPERGVFFFDARSLHGRSTLLIGDSMEGQPFGVATRLETGQPATE